MVFLDKTRRILSSMNKFPFIDLSPIPDVSPDTITLIVENQECPSAEQFDILVVRRYLGCTRLSQKTIENSQKELNRFLSWCRFEVKKTLLQLSLDDLNGYKEFLRNPPQDWISKTKWPRSDPRYRPLTGPLSDASRFQAILAVKALLSFAEQTGYLQGNKSALLRNVSSGARNGNARALEPEAVALAIRTVLHRAPDSEKSRRQRERDHFLLIAYARTGVRLSEIVDANMGAIYSTAPGRWWFNAGATGHRLRRVPVPSEMLCAFRKYREAFGLPIHAEREDETPLVLSSTKRARTRVTDEAASEAIKSIFVEAAVAAELAGDLDVASNLRLASTHWLRHGMLTDHVNKGVALATLQAVAGHVHIGTTAAYLRKTDIEQHDEIIAALNKTSE